MSVRVCYMTRGPLGATLRGLRLVGHASDERWPAESQAPDVDAGAAWVRERLAGTRAGGALAMLCLDVEGGICSWLSAPSASVPIVSTIARNGPVLPMTEGEPSDRPGRAASSPVEFYAGDAYSSSIQPLGPGVAAGPAGLQRLAVLSMSDVPARLLMDALDRSGVAVESVASLWHAMAMAWDPGMPRAAMVETAGDSEAPVTGILVVDVDAARLLWTWTRAGQLLVAGSMRLRRVQPETTALAEAGTEAAAPLVLAYGPDDIARLTVEWLSWAAQVGHAPSRFVCVLADSEQAPAFGQALGRAWPGATVDAVIQHDPVAATLVRTAEALERTPAATDEDPRRGLIDLTSRPGRSHRQLYMWWSGAVAAAAVVLATIGWRMNAASADERAAAAQWRAQQDEAITQVMPGVKPAPGKSTLVMLTEEVARRDKDLEGPRRPDNAATMPIVEELQTISFIVGNNGLSLDSLELDSRGSPRFVAFASDTGQAEDLTEALKRIAGSHVTDWKATVVQGTGTEASKVRGTYSGKWAAPAKADTRPAPPPAPTGQPPQAGPI